MNYEKELTESELKLIRNQLNPHFIFNTLNTIQSYLSSNDSFKAMTHLSKLGKFIRNILEYSGERLISLEEELDNINLYLELEKFRFTRLFNFKIDFENRIKPETLLVTPFTIFPFVENILKNELLVSQTPGFLELNFYIRNEKLMCNITVKDKPVVRSKKTGKNTGQSLNPRHLNKTTLHLSKQNDKITNSKNAVSLKKEAEPADVKTLLSFPLIYA